MGRAMEKLGEEADRQSQCAGTVRGEEGRWFVTKNDIKKLSCGHRNSSEDSIY